MKGKLGKFKLVFSAAVIAVFLVGMVLAAGAVEPGGGASGGAKVRVDIDTPPAGDIEKVKSCPYCGMDRQKFAHSRVFVEYDNGSVLGTCSVHCAAVDMAVNIDKGPLKIWVGDYNTKELVNAEKAVWVLGGDQMGVMTKRAKWAFGAKDDADQYIKAHGGKITGFEEVMAATFEDMYQDTKMIRERRAKKRMMQMQHGK